MNRRRFLGLAGVAGAAAGTLLVQQRRLTLIFDLQHSRIAGALRDLLEAPGVGTRVLSTAEEEGLLALATVLLPSATPRDGFAAVREHLRWRATTAPGCAHAFARGLGLLDEHARRRGGARFAERAPADRSAIVHHLLAGVRPIRRVRDTPSHLLHLAADSAWLARERLRWLVANEILRGFYTSASGWAVVGRHAAVPGRCDPSWSYAAPDDTRPGVADMWLASDSSATASAMRDAARPSP
jgi:hypothetical protein